MKIAISGATGFVGTHLKEIFETRGYEIISLGRQDMQPGMEDALRKTISGCDVVINLAGASINHRWTGKYKQKIYDSRIIVTRRLVAAINALDVKPRLMISASAVGYYSSAGCFSESDSKPGKGFLSKICVEWEKEAQEVSHEVRLVITRFGVILAPEGGAFSKMILPAKYGVATVMGNGQQPFSWVDLEDVGRAIEFIMEHNEIKGIVNLVAPQQINNLEFTKAVAARFNSRLTIKIPSAFLHVVMGESAGLIMQGQCAIPDKLLKSGFTFRSDKIEEFLKTKIK